jgi:hypothetical protein
MHKLIVLIVLLFVGCRAAPATPAAETAVQAAQISLTVDPEPAAVGEARLNVAVTRDGQPLAGVKLDVRGDMTHAGMKPVLGSATTDAQGVAVVPFRWTMGGDWIVTVTATLADGAQVSQEFDLTVKT